VQATGEEGLFVWIGVRPSERANGENAGGGCPTILGASDGLPQKIGKAVNSSCMTCRYCAQPVNMNVPSE
jgi:hypothetical protein